MSALAFRLPLLIYLTLCTLSAVAADVRAVPLKPASKSLVTQRSLEQLCAGLAEPCAPDKLRAFLPAHEMPAPIYLIDEAGPALLGVKRLEDGELKLLFRHDFRDYSPNTTREGWADEGPRRIFPALYPVRPNAWAVALVSARSEMYSGGGANFEKADFIVLGNGTALHASIPFNCSKMIRACFSEEDYRSGRPCHNEYSGTLSIRYRTLRTTKDYAWQFLWHADGDRRGKVFTRPDNANFCNGDQRSTT